MREAAPEKRPAKMKTAPPRLKRVDSWRLRAPDKTATPIYHTPAYRAWREAVIKRAGGSCQGALPDGRACGRREPRMFADHIVELRDGGAPFDLANGQCLCGSCHSLKTAAARTIRAGGG